MPSAGFETAISAGERLQTYALDRSAIAIGKRNISVTNLNPLANKMWYYICCKLVQLCYAMLMFLSQ
jgi:hypothetical protein